MEAGREVKSLSHSNLPFLTSPVLMLSRFKLNYKGEISHWEQARCVFGRMRGGDVEVMRVRIHPRPLVRCLHKIARFAKSASCLKLLPQHTNSIFSICDIW